MKAKRGKTIRTRTGYCSKIDWRKEGETDRQTDCEWLEEEEKRMKNAHADDVVRKIYY